ncbi:TrbC/VirB2 family protein [Achromobacter aegrifaciens]|uniref:TrbC/VirB2 family protein n=1 Tax=Achromobacter aegrifaciens TaxID=1287736 RepID=UPI0027BA545A|nr:TrbC/VirB2 family protein [Achromobacter aegrifaciens]WLW63621.1 TrbC/VirB2 family protein [Achromobacter aegrifaciens]
MRHASRNLTLFALAFVLIALVGMPTPALAQLAKATTVVTKVKEWLWIILPVICLIAGGICGLLYSFDVIRKETAYQWAAGVTFAGAIAGGIIELAF